MYLRLSCKKTTSGQSLDMFLMSCRMASEAPSKSVTAFRRTDQVACSDFSIWLAVSPEFAHQHAPCGKHEHGKQIWLA